MLCFYRRHACDIMVIFVCSLQALVLPCCAIILLGAYEYQCEFVFLCSLVLFAGALLACTPGLFHFCPMDPPRTVTNSIAGPSAAIARQPPCLHPLLLSCCLCAIGRLLLSRCLRAVGTRDLLWMVPWREEEVMALSSSRDTISCIYYYYYY